MTQDVGARSAAGQRALTAIVWLIPLALGLLGTVSLRIRLEQDAGTLDTGDRAFLLGAAVLVPASCYAATAALRLLLRRGLPRPRRDLVCALVGSLVAIGSWLLAFT